MPKRIVVAAGAVVAAALLPVSGVAHADDVIVGDGGVAYSWATEAQCMADGPDLHLEANDDFYKYWYCEQHDDDLWYLHNTDQLYRP